MRELGMSEMWYKLYGDEFTTFRFKRKDRDWEIDENVRIVYRPRSKERKVLGEAFINSKTTKNIFDITEKEAQADGFKNLSQMLGWLAEKTQLPSSDINKLSIRWTKRY